MTEDELILKANEIWDSEKQIIRDVSRAISYKYKGMPKELRQAVFEAGRAAFVHCYLGCKSGKF